MSCIFDYQRMYVIECLFPPSRVYILSFITRIILSSINEFNFSIRGKGGLDILPNNLKVFQVLPN